MLQKDLGMRCGHGVDLGYVIEWQLFVIVCLIAGVLQLTMAPG